MNLSFFNKQIIFCSALLLAVIVVFEYCNIDLWIQNYFYNFSKNRWFIDRDNPLLKFIFYDGIKILLISILVLMFLGLIFYWKMGFIRNYRISIIVVIISGALVPSIIGILKSVSNVPCPRNIENYNGDRSYIRIFDNRVSNKDLKKSRCWPAGHASGGFALLSLFFLFHRKRNRIIALFSALVIGWSMGMYKTMIGDHFISHTIITMIMAWMIIITTKRVVEFFGKKYGI